MERRIRKQQKEDGYNTALYIRLSREDGDREESDSVGNQRKLLLEYVNRDKDLIPYKEYVDDGYTGTNFQRPAFQEMMEDLKKGIIRCVIVKDLSRFGRDYIDTGYYLERVFPSMGVRFISISDRIDSIRQCYDMLLPIKNIFNEQYARDISHKIQATVKIKQKAGEFIGAFAGYGYQKDPGNRNRLIVDEYAASVVRRIYSLYSSGMGKQSIAKMLNEEGILCPSEYKKVNGENYKNGNRSETAPGWTYSTIHGMLQNELYIGTMVQGKKHQQMRGKQQIVDQSEWIRVKHTHEPIIDGATWRNVQQLLKSRQRGTYAEPGVNLFAGFLKCGDCGKAMVRNGWQKADGKKVFSFYCGSYKRNGKSYCSPHHLKQEVLEQIVLKDLNTVIRSLDYRKLCFQQQNDDCENTSFDKERKKIKKEREDIRIRIRELYEDYKEQLLSKEEFLSYRNRYAEKEQLWERRLEEVEQRFMESQQKKRTIQLQEKEILQEKGITKLNREMVLEMIEEILVYENHIIRIRYRFADKPESYFFETYSSE